MLLALSTWPEIEARLARSRTVVIPIGSNEQHGPTGLLGTDWLCPEIIAHAAHDEGDLLVGPTFAVGMAQHHLGFPGSISLRPSTMIAAIRDWTVSLAAHGFDKIYWLNGHGGNVSTIEAAFSEIYAEASYLGRPRGYALKLKNWWDLAGVSKLCVKLFPEGHGTHATPSEIAVTQFGYPGSIKSANYAPRIAPTGPIRESVDFRARYADGRMGSDPGQASPEKGGEIVAMAVKALAADVRAFEVEPFPGRGGVNPDFQATAEEELVRALDLSWLQLSKIIPWGDSYEGVAVGGREVQIERSYLWADQPGGDILCEVKVYAGETRYDEGGAASAIIRRP